MFFVSQCLCCCKDVCDTNVSEVCVYVKQENNCEQMLRM